MEGFPLCPWITRFLVSLFCLGTCVESCYAGPVAEGGERDRPVPARPLQQVRAAADDSINASSQQVRVTAAQTRPAIPAGSVATALHQTAAQAENETSTDLSPELRALRKPLLAILFRSS